MATNQANNLLFSFTKKDFRVDWYSPGKSGGQNINKHANACRIKHLESGLMASCQKYKSQTQNKKEAFRKLAKLLVSHYIPKHQKERGELVQKNTRTYNKNKDLVKDHLTGDTFSYKNTIDKGDMSEIIEARQQKLTRGEK